MACPSTMPVSSTVWWSSTAMSPSARTSRSITPCRATCLEHVLEEGDAGGEVCGPGAVERDGDRDASLSRVFSFDGGRCGKVHVASGSCEAGAGRIA